MKSALIYGEFIGKSTTGIAYVNTNLKKVLEELGYKIKIFHEPRSNEYSSNKKNFKRKINIVLFSKLIFNLLITKKNNISFITISMTNLGLIKTYIIQSLLKKKTNNVYLYIHRGDLDYHYKESILKKTMINMILNKSYKIIILSNKFINHISLRNHKKKIFIIANSLNKKDYKISAKLYKIKPNKSYKHTNKINFIFAGNIHKSKGIHNIISSIKMFNKKNNLYQINLDIYGIWFEDINCDEKFINYKGKLENNNRLEVMSNYDFLISASISEGLPITLIECMAIGIPFITTKVGAIDDLLINNYPYLCNSDPKSILLVIEKSVKDLIDNKFALKKIIRSNNDLFKRKFKYEKFFSSVKQLLDD